MSLRFTFVRQDDQSDCGSAALATVAIHYQMPIGVQRLRDLAGTDRVGTNLRGMVDAAEQLGFSAKAVKGPWESLSEIPLPAIAHVVNEEGMGHFVVLHRVKNNSIIIADPAKSVEKLSRETFCERWTGYLLILTPDESRALRASESAPRSPWSRLLILFSRHVERGGEDFIDQACGLRLRGRGLWLVGGDHFHRGGRDLHLEFEQPPLDTEQRRFDPGHRQFDALGVDGSRRGRLLDRIVPRHLVEARARGAHQERQCGQQSQFHHESPRRVV